MVYIYIFLVVSSVFYNDFLVFFRVYKWFLGIGGTYFLSGSTLVVFFSVDFPTEED